MARGKKLSGTTKITLPVFTDDLEVLRSHYRKAGYSAAIRSLIQQHARRIEEAKNRVAKPVELEIDLELEETTHD